VEAIAVKKRKYIFATPFQKGNFFERLIKKMVR
jgi:hypothetical protein